MNQKYDFEYFEYIKKCCEMRNKKMNKKKCYEMRNEINKIKLKSRCFLYVKV